MPYLVQAVIGPAGAGLKPALAYFRDKNRMVLFFPKFTGVNFENAKSVSHPVNK